MKILFVCLGNICRSPLAEGIMRDKVKESSKSIKLDSAGTGNWHAGEAPDARAIKVARNHNVDISDLRARQFRISDFNDFDKIYVMDQNNYSDVLALARNEDDASKVDLLLNMSYPKQNRSVPDPYYGGDQGFENVFNMLDEACQMIIDNH